MLNPCVLVILISSLIFVNGLSPDSRQKRQRPYAITNFDIDRSIKKLESKLARHEYREVQLADFTMKTFRGLIGGHATAKRDIQKLSKQLAKMEEKMFAIESLLSTTDARQRHILEGLGNGINRLITMSSSNELLPLPGGIPQLESSVNGDELKLFIKKIDEAEGTIQNGIQHLNKEVTVVSEDMKHHMSRLELMLNGHLERDASTNNQTLVDVAEMMTRTSNRFTQELIEVKRIVGTPSSTGECGIAVKEIAQKLESMDEFQRRKTQEMTIVELETQKALESQKRDMQSLLKANQAESQLVEKSFQSIVQNLQNLQAESEKQLGILETNIEHVLDVSEDKINAGINNVASTLKLKATNVLDALEDLSEQNENTQDAMRDSFADLTAEIRGLKRLEQVMISTADAVLDTKRSIEFGIQQVIIELSDIVRSSGSTINSTLTDRINDISFAILKNQTSALTNMTAKIEREISQVWRQIGVMYQQILQSVDILDDLQSTTSHQMNQSLNTVDNMDGTVGKINSKVAGVEDDLNYLLGRLTLVVSEFSQLKSGVGDELDRLRDMTKEFSNDAIVEYQLQNEEPDPEAVAAQR